MRVGFGYDIHPLVSDRPLILGGVQVPFSKGLAGHSDADVLCHAIADALLGAASLGDIGEHFPDSDPAYRGVSSILLLEKTCEKIRNAGFSVSNVDASVILEIPKLSPYKKIMAENIARALQVLPDAISVKAKTNERFGETGRGEAVAAYAAVLLQEAGNR